MLYVYGLVFHGDSLLHGYYMHADTAAAHGNERSHFLQREEGHTLEEHGKFRVLVHKRYAHVGVLCAAGNKHGNPVNAVFTVERGAWIRALAVCVMVSVVVLQHTEDGKFIQELIQGFVVRGEVLFGVKLMKLGIAPVLPYLEGAAGKHCKEKVQRGFTGYGIHLILEDAGKAPVFRGFGCHLDFSGNPVRDVTDEFNELGIGVFVAKVLGDKLF